MTHEDRIAQILGAWQERRDEGDFVDPESLCAEHPDLADELRMRLAALNIVEQAYAESRMFEGAAPRRLGEYEIVREIGRGGMGVVYEAVQTSMKRTVALKVLFPSVTNSRRAVERFQREARAAGRVQHTNIVPVYSLSREAGTWYYAMELVQGSSLSSLLRHLRELGGEPGEEHRTLLRTNLPPSEELETLPEDADPAATMPTASQFTETHGSGRYYRDVARLFADVADALQAAHDAGVVHRDLKPSNLILDDTGVLKIVDFGIARIGSEASGMTVTGELLGTPIYMSPEQARARGHEVDHRTDIYSFGASLYEVLTLRTPFQGTTFPEVYQQILTTQPVAPRRHSATIPRDLETIVLKAMEKKATNRYAKAGALAHDLRAFADGYGIDARRVGPATKFARLVRRNRVRSGLAAALLIALCTAAYLGVRGADEERRRVDLEYAALLADAEAVSDLVGHGLWKRDTPLDMYFREQRALRDAPHIAKLDRAIALAPDRAAAWLRRALVSSRSKDERLADLTEAHKYGAADRTVALARALVYRDNGERAESEELEQELLTSHSDDPLEAYLVARLQEERSEWRSALATLDGLFQRTQPGRFERIQALLMRAHVRERLGDREGALTDLAAYLELGGRSLSVRVRLAWHWHCLDRKDAAEKKFAALLDEVGAAEVEVWQELADACAEARARAWGVRATQLAIERHPDSLPLLLAHFWALNGRSRQPEAVAVAKRAMELAPEDPLVLYARGVAYLNAGEQWRALQDLRRAAAARPDDIGILGALASAFRAKHRYRKALATHDRILELTPRRAHAWSSKARTLGLIRQFDDATACQDKAIELDPSNVNHLVDKAGLLRVAGQMEAAADVLAGALKREALSASVLVNAASELNNLKRRAEAVELSERAIQRNPENPFAYYTLAHGLYWLERVDEAKRACRAGLAIDPLNRTLRNFYGLVVQAAEGLPAALALYDEWLKERPRDSHLWRGRGYFLLRMDQVDDGLAAYAEAVRLEPRNAALHLERSAILVNLTRLDAALEAARDAQRVTPDDPPTLMSVAGLLNTLRRHDEALKLLDRVLVLDPGNGGAHGFRSYAFRARKEFDRALQEASKGIELDPYSTSAWEMRAQVFQELGQFEKALADVEKALELSPGSSHAAVTRADILLRLGRNEEALAAAQDAVARHPRDSSALNALANVLGLLGREREALAMLRKASVLSPDSAVILGNIGKALVLLGKHREAIDVLEKSIDLDPQARALADLAACYGALGRGDDELAALRRAVDLSPPHFISHNNLVVGLHQRGAHEECARWAQTMSERFPEHATPHFARASSLWLLGRRKAADEALEAGRRRVKADDARGYMKWQNVLRRMERHADALEILPDLVRALETMAKREPGNAEYAIALGDVRLKHARSLHKLQRLAEAERAYTQALEVIRALHARGTPWVQVRVLLASCELKFAYLYWEQRKLREACELARPAAARCQKLEAEGTVVPMWPLSGAEFLFLLATQEAKASAFPEAIAHLEQALAHVKRYGEQHPELRRKEAPLVTRLLRALRLATGAEKPTSLMDHANLAYFHSTQTRDMRRAYGAFSALVADPAGRADSEGMHLYNAACTAGVLARETKDDAEAAQLREQAMTWLTRYVEDWQKRIQEPPPDGDPAVRAGLSERFEKMRKHALQDDDLVDLRETKAFRALFETP